jgi:hypothetical protein
MKVKIVTTSVFFSHLSTCEIDFSNDETFQFTIFFPIHLLRIQKRTFPKFKTNFLFKFQFFILVALFAVAAADSYKAAEYKAPKYEAPKYEAPKYETPKYEAPKYEAPKYEAPKYETPKAPKYETPKYEAPKYQAPKYETPKYESPKYEEVTYVSYN